MTAKMDSAVLWLTGQPNGRTSHEYARDFGVTLISARDFLWRLSKSGRIAQVGRCTLARWCLPIYAEALLAAQDQHKAEMHRAKKRRLSARRRVTRNEQKGLPTQRQEAFEAARFVPIERPARFPRVNSVWQLGAA